MTSNHARKARVFAAGSLAAVVIAVALTPFNMGGCDSPNLPGVQVHGINVTQVGSGLFQAGSSAVMNEKSEDAIGQSVALQATNRWRIYQDPDLNKYLTKVARVVATASIEPQIKPNVALLDTDEVNAFSGPHGYIFITRGALVRMHDESELAGVLGHEIGHLCKHHGLAAVKTAGFWGGLAQAGAGADQHAAQFSKATQAALDAVINVGFSEPQEIEADREGVSYVIAAGYDPNGFLNFLNRLAVEQGKGGKLFATHPGLGDRIKLVSEQISKSGAGGRGSSLADRFHARVTLPGMAKADDVLPAGAVSLAVPQ